VRPVGWGGSTYICDVRGVAIVLLEFVDLIHAFMLKVSFFPLSPFRLEKKGVSLPVSWARAKEPCWKNRKNRMPCAYCQVYQ
jgi:hypothetical protein